MEDAEKYRLEEKAIFLEAEVGDQMIQLARYGLIAGAAKTVITPDAEGTFLIGPMQSSTGVNDALWARALVLSDSRNRIAILTLDYLGFDFAYNDILIQAASESSGIPSGNIMINCSHTHSAPITIPWGPWDREKDKPFHSFLPEKIAEITKQASLCLEPVRLRYRRESTQVGFNRRFFDGQSISMAPNPNGAILPWVDVLSIERMEGKPVAVLFSHAAHPVIVHGASTLISADYPGFAVETLMREHGKETVYMFAQGCSANINGFPLRSGIDAASGAGRDLGLAVCRALKAMGEEIPIENIQVESVELKLPLQDPPSVERCQEMLEQEKDAERQRAFSELLTTSQSVQPPSVLLPIRAFGIGNFCILGLAHEMFAEYHHYINEVSPFLYNMVLAYTNGVECYVGTKKDYDLGGHGGYETAPMGAAFLYQPRLPLAPQSEELIQNGLKRILDQLTAG